MEITELKKRINGMFRACTDMVKTDPSEIAQEKIDNAYNSALINVLLLLEESKCDHDWYEIPETQNKGKWKLCKKCKDWLNYE